MNSNYLTNSIMRTTNWKKNLTTRSNLRRKSWSLTTRSNLRTRNSTTMKNSNCSTRTKDYCLTTSLSWTERKTTKRTSYLTKNCYWTKNWKATMTNWTTISSNYLTNSTNWTGSNSNWNWTQTSSKRMKIGSCLKTMMKTTMNYLNYC